jgi:3-methyladenine DNA glycosylase AlkD
MPNALDAVRRDVRALADPARATHALRFFRTGPGEYGEGDRFLGLTVPQIRTLVRRHAALPRDAVLTLLQSEWHEERLLALLLLVHAYERGDAETRAAITRDYLAHTAHVNNWDLVDASAGTLLGASVAASDLRGLDRLARSSSLWERRIAIVATFHHTKAGDVAPALHVAERLLGDRHDLIHKAVGWMLREAGKRDRAALEAFLDAHHDRLPRTTLRYAIERFPEAERRAYLARRARPR